jgi:NADP-dependent 3-hydroxy acid dehydrogenase YdfG
LPNADIEKIVATNLTGLMLANRIVLAGFVQQGNGQIWNMEGYGSNGATQSGMASYGATKRAVHYLNRALRKEAAEYNKENSTNIQVCILSPGIVVTDLLIGDYDTKSEQWKKVRKIFNILGDKVETVTPWLVDGVLASNKNGAEVAWLTGGKAFTRFLKATFVKRDLFSEMGI